MHRQLRQSAIALLIAALLVTALPSSNVALAAVEREWTGASSTNWSDGANWVGGSPPVSGDALFFPPNAARKTNTNDIVGLTLTSIQLSGGYDVSGQAVILGSIGSIGSNRVDFPIAGTGGPDITISPAFERDELILGGGFVGTGLQVSKPGRGLVSLEGGGPDNGSIAIGDGILVADSAMPTAAFDIAGGVLTGAGPVRSVSASGGILAPGDFGLGTLAMTDLTLQPGSALFVDLGQSANGRVAVDLTANLSSPELLLFREAPFDAGTAFTIVSAAGVSGGSFAGLPQGATLALGSQQFQVDYTAGAGHDVTVTATNTPTPSERFVDAVYLDLLSRFVDGPALGVWTARLAQGFPRAFVSAIINTSTEYREVLVSDIYGALLRRDADPAGLEGFVSFLSRGGRDEDVIAAVLGSEEYFDLTHSHSAFLTLLYSDLLGRAPDPAGFDQFLSLMFGGMPRGAVASAILHSPEYYAAFVDSLYAGLLHRAADGPGRTLFATLLQQGTTYEMVLNHFIASAEYFNRAQSSLVPSSVAATTRARTRTGIPGQKSIVAARLDAALSP